MFPSGRRAIGAFIGKIMVALGMVLLTGALLLGYLLRFLVKPELVLPICAIGMIILVVGIFSVRSYTRRSRSLSLVESC
jgi:ABC-type dipeptide/oligopeptide/nickel transport system permease subunit